MSQGPVKKLKEKNYSKLADSFIDCVREDFEIGLDYTPESLQKLDELQESMHSLLIGKNTNFSIILLGAYFGEVMRRNLGGQWDAKHKLGVAVELVQDRIWSFPFTTARDWLVSGDESFAFSYKRFREKRSEVFES